MHLFVDGFGTFIGKKENRFVVGAKDKKEEFSADHVKQIIIASASSLSAGAVKFAAENGIDIVFLGKFGMPEGAAMLRRVEGFNVPRGTEVWQNPATGSYFFREGFMPERNPNQNAKTYMTAIMMAPATSASMIENTSQRFKNKTETLSSYGDPIKILPAGDAKLDEPPQAFLTLRK